MHASTPPTPASQCPCLGTPPEPKPCSGELPGTPTSSPPLPEGLLPLPPQGERSGKLAACGGTTARRGLGEAGGGGRKLHGPRGVRGLHPGTPVWEVLALGRLGSCPNLGPQGPPAPAARVPFCKRGVCRQQRPLSPARRGGLPAWAVCPLPAPSRGWANSGACHLQPWGARPTLRLPPSVSLRLRWLGLKFQLLWGHPALCPTNGPSPKSRPLLKRAPIGAREKPQPASSRPPTAWGPRAGSDESTSGSQPQQPL